MLTRYKFYSIMRINMHLMNTVDALQDIQENIVKITNEEDIKRYEEELTNNYNKLIEELKNHKEIIKAVYAHSCAQDL